MTMHPIKAPRTKPVSRAATYVLRLYINDGTPKSKVAVENLRRTCEAHLLGRYDLQVIDIQQQTKLAREEQIVAVPTLIKRLPAPLQRFVGDLSDVTSVLAGLDLRARGATEG